MPTSNLISVTEIETLIITCSADIDHKDEIAKQLPNFEGGTRGRDYLEIVLPGAFPTHDTFSVMESLILRYNVKTIAVVAHSDCGLALAVKKRIETPEITPRLFTSESKNVHSAIDSSDSTDSVISTEISKLISKTVATSLMARAAEIRENSASSMDAEQEQSFAKMIENIEIITFSSNHDEGRLELTIPGTPLSELI